MPGILTDRQREIYEFIRGKILEGYPPATREIGAAFGISSPNGVKCHLKALIAKGYLRRVTEGVKARNLRLAEEEEPVDIRTYAGLVRDLRRAEASGASEVVRLRREVDAMTADILAGPQHAPPAPVSAGRVVLDDDGEE